MNTVFRCKIKPYIQPFEKKLALAELFSLTSSPPQPLPSLDLEVNEFEIVSSLEIKDLTDRLAYWEFISSEKESGFTTQILREATVSITRNGITPEKLRKFVPFGWNVPLPNRRCLRYGTHGIHEYRGKFFPQLVRALINIADVPNGGIIADPMSGSGTTLVEAVLGNYQGIGIDMNPLSVLMTQTKCSLMFINPEELICSYDNIIKKIKEVSVKQKRHNLDYFYSLPNLDQKYLMGWFSESVILALDIIVKVIYEESNISIQNFFKVVLSNIIRPVSWQKQDDLRVRKEKKEESNINPVEMFLEELKRSTKSVLAFLWQNQNLPLGKYFITEGDARDITQSLGNWFGKVDVIITSPPYATALPYLDTDRLSLYYLKLLSRPEHRKRDQEMIGNREITNKNRQIHWDLFLKNKSILPASVVELIQKIERLNADADVGFRRKNMPSLLAKYFLDMRLAFLGMQQMLKPNSMSYVVIGNNYTVAGGEKVDIETAFLLKDIAEMTGFASEEVISMEMLVSRDIFKKNAVASEHILCLRRLP